MVRAYPQTHRGIPPRRGTRLRSPRLVGRGEVRYHGEFDNTPDAVAKLVRNIGDRYETLHFCDEAARRLRRR